MICMQKRMWLSLFLLFKGCLDIYSAKLPKCIWIDFFYHHGFSKQNITFFTVKHLYALTADVNDKKTVYVAPAKQSAPYESLCPSSVCLYVYPSVCPVCHTFGSYMYNF